MKSHIYEVSDCGGKEKGRQCCFTDGLSPDFIYQNVLQSTSAPLRVLTSSLTAASKIHGFLNCLRESA